MDLKIEMPDDTPKKEKKMTDIQKVVTAWKLLNGIPEDNKAWDRVFFKRYSKTAKDLVAVMGNWQEAVKAVEWVKEDLDRKGLDCAFETTLKRLDMYLEHRSRGPR